MDGKNETERENASTKKKLRVTPDAQRRNFVYCSVAIFLSDAAGCCGRHFTAKKCEQHLEARSRRRLAALELVGFLSRFVHH